MNSQAGSDVELEDRPCRACAATPQPSGYVTLIMSQLQEPHRPPPTVQDTGNPITRLLMCGNFTLSFLLDFGFSSAGGQAHLRKRKILGIVILFIYKEKSPCCLTECSKKLDCIGTQNWIVFLFKCKIILFNFTDAFYVLII